MASTSRGSTNTTIGGTDPSQRNFIGRNGDGIVLDHATGNRVLGNFLGTNLAGTGSGIVYRNGNNGINIFGGGGNTIGGTASGSGNLISGNVEAGVLIAVSSSGNIVLGNLIGTDTLGGTALPNGTGVEIDDSSNNTIGGTISGSMNLISGNAGPGILLKKTTANSADLIVGNRIGTNLAGTSAVPNGGAGIQTSQSGGATIGGIAAGAGNLISGNVGDGLYFDFAAPATGNLAQGNTIGLNVSGAALANHGDGIDVSGFNNNTIGGTVAGSGNIISGNLGLQILLASTGNIVQGNVIDLNPGGTAALSLTGIKITGSKNTVGGSGAGSGNLIGGGVDVSGGSATLNVVAGNSIGMNAAGTVALGGPDGIVVENGASGNTIGGIAGNIVVVTGGGGLVGGIVLTDSATTGNVVAGNLVGLTPDGKHLLGTPRNGILIASAQNNTIGGTTAAARNLVDGAQYGIDVFGSASANVVEGNYVGTDISGTISLGNAYGITVAGSNNTIGGTVAGSANVISGNSLSGTSDQGYGLAVGGSNTLVVGNFIGVGADGHTAVPNPVAGVVVSGYSATIGGTSAGARNVISGNTNEGVYVASGSAGTSILGNFIGVDSSGTAAAPNHIGVLVRDASNATIGGTAVGAGNVISGNSTGVEIDGSSSSVAVLGNLIGTDMTGQARPSGAVQSLGVFVGPAYYGGTPSNNSIGASASGSRNVIAGNSGDGVLLASGSIGTTLAGNYIGTDITGGTPLGNSIGVSVASGSNVIGGSVFGSRNVISGNSATGIALGGASAASNVILGNYIGLDASGTQPLGNSVGVAVGDSANSLTASNNTVGGTAFAARNIISGNASDGVDLFGSGNVVEGNYIGTDASGSSARGNAGAGVHLFSSASAISTGNTIGGGAKNVISANSGDGIQLSGGSGTVVQTNFIGTDVIGTTPLGNLGSGVKAVGVDPTTSIGSTVSGGPNLIAYNGSTASGVTAGVLTTGGSGIVIRDNSFHDNVGLGIDLGGDGVTPSGLTISSASSSGGSSTIGGTLSGGAPNTLYAIDIYTMTGTDPSGYGEGTGFLGTKVVTTNGSGSVTFSAVLPVPLPSHAVITAEATNLNGGGSTEFAHNLGGDRPPVAVAGSSFSVQAGTTVTLDGTGSSDPDNDPLTYSWNFGDGSTATGSKPTHAFTTPGTFKVTLTVNDGFGLTSSATLSATVTNAAPTFASNGYSASQTISSGTSSGRFGTSVATFTSGDYAVGAPGDGTVTLYYTDAKGNAQVLTLSDPDGQPSTDGFGQAIAALDSSLLIVGAPTDATSGAGNGAAFLFDANSESPTFGQLLGTFRPSVASGETNIAFGAAVASFGTEVVVGAPGKTGGAGAAYVFNADPTSASFGTMALPAILDPTANPGDGFGTAVVGIGTDLAISAPNASGLVNGIPRPHTGVVYAFDATGAQVGSPTADPDAGLGNNAPLFGQSLTTINNDLVVGAPGTVNNGTTSGAVYLFDLLGTGLKLAKFLSPVSELNGAGFGSALASTGTELLIGAPKSSLGDGQAGAAYLYDVTIDASNVTHSTFRGAVQAPSPAPGDGFGTGLGFVGSTIVAGAPGSLSAPGRAFILPASSPLTVNAMSVGETPAGMTTVIVGGTVLDPGGGETHTVLVDWKDGSTTTVNLAVGQSFFTATHNYPQDSSTAYAITARVTDSFGASGTAGVAVTVHNDPPTIATLTVSPGTTILEGTKVLLTGSFTDPGALDSHDVTVHWGDGSSDYTFHLAAGVTSFNAGSDPNLSHVYADNPTAPATSFGLSVTVKDNGGGSTVRNVPVTVQNGAPTLSGVALSALNINEGDSVTLSGQVADPGVNDSHTLTIDWGDGSGLQTIQLAPGSQANKPLPGVTPFSVTHQYVNNTVGLSPSSFVVTVTATDKDLASTSTSPGTVRVTNLSPKASIGEDPALNTDPSMITLTSTASDPGPVDNLSLNYSWTLTRTDGGVETLQGVGSAFKHFTFASDASNTYDVALTVTDLDGLSDTVMSLVIVPTGSSYEVTGDLHGHTQAVVLSNSDGFTVDATKSTIPVFVDAQGMNSTVLGGPGNDTIVTGHGNDSINGGMGNNYYNVVIGSSPTITQPNAPGTVATIDLSRTNFAVSVDLSITGTPQMVDQSIGRNDSLTLNGSFQDLIDTSGNNDTLMGNSGDNLIRGGTGDDLLFGGAGNDTIYSGSAAGNQSTLKGGAGSSLLFGGLGNDSVVSGSLAGGHSTLVGGPGNQILFGGLGNDSLVSGSLVGNQTTLMGGPGNQILFGGLGNDTLMATGSGQNTLVGGSGAQLLFGGLGNDSIVSNSGPTTPHTVVGGGGSDILFGGLGPDTVGAGSFSPTGQYTPGTGNSTIVGGPGRKSSSAAWGTTRSRAGPARARSPATAGRTSSSAAPATTPSAPARSPRAPTAR